MGGILGVIGILGIFKGNTNAAYGIGSLMILLNFGYNISVGPLCKRPRYIGKLIFRLHYCCRAAQHPSPTSDHCHCSNCVHLVRYSMQPAHSSNA